MTSPPPLEIKPSSSCSLLNNLFNLPVSYFFSSGAHPPEKHLGSDPELGHFSFAIFTK